MDITDRRALKDTAASALAQAPYDPRKLITLHIAVSLGVSLLATLLNFILTRQIDSTGGLSGMQLRSILSTAQSVLQIASSLLLPFWEVGLMHAVLRLARRQPAEPSSLLEGLRRFGPVLRLMLLESVIFSAVFVVCSYISTGIFLMTPLAEPMTQTLLPLMEDASLTTQELVLDDATITLLTQQVMPMLYILIPVLCLVCIPLWYRLRMANYVLMDQERCGAIAAFTQSWKMTKRSCLKLFRLDLSFWWFYVLDALITAICYGDVLLPKLGVALPMTEDTAFFVFYGAHVLCRALLYWRANAQVQTSYAVAYETLRQQPEPPAAPASPKNLPWDQ